ncbi:condensation domain-containing protein [Actinospica robiniae]|uniref:condensation domain-containing protein n=1 Tax=Actinospica robiniae TaxID=304901 RepID=UPI00041BE7C1|nr:condensation domain-containing protein [Actinospica robiniae]
MSDVVVTSVSVGFRGGEGRSGSLAWGQQALWNAIRRTRPEDQYFNFSREFTPAGRAGIEDVTDALARVLARHEALRTTLVADEALPEQVVHGAGKLNVDMHCCAAADVDSVAAATAAEYESRAFDYVGELPLRVAFVTTDDDAVARVVFCFCHLAADFGGSQVVLDDLAGYLRADAEPASPAPQPLDLVATQNAPTGRRASERALDYWEAEYRRIPPTMFPVARAAAQDPPFWTGALSSPALGDALALVAARCEVGDSAVILAACAALAAELEGHELCAMLAIVGNRFRPAQRALVSSLSMEGLLTLDIDRDATFADLVRRTWSASVRMYRAAEYDEAGRDAMFARVDRDRGESVHPYCCYNDLRGGPDRPAGTVDGPGPGLDALRAARERSEFSWARKLPKVSCRFCVHVVGGAPLFRIDLTADTRYLPPDTIERYLRGVEHLLVESAGREVAVGELAGMLR